MATRRTGNSALAGLLLGCLLMNAPVLAVEVPANARSRAAAARVTPALTADLARFDQALGVPVFVRIYKQESQLELWIAGEARYRLFRSYPICTWSGTLGPKQRQGDYQAPEGFYQVAARQLNPASSYHLSFNLGYPNAYDRAHQRSGDYLMVHGRCVSIGCYAMGDAAIEEIYTLLSAALAGGQQSVPVHIFPFRYRPGWEREHPDSPWLDFWRQLEAGHAAFERDRVPPKVVVRDRRYQVAP